MKWLLAVLLILALALVTGAPMVHAATYYVDYTLGNDSWSGTLSAPDGEGDGPWKTISKINSSQAVLSPGDSVLFKMGETWHDQLNINRSGTSGSTITYGAYGEGDLPNIQGNLIKSSWTGPDGNGAYYTAHTGAQCNYVVEDGVILWPQASDATLADGLWYFDNAGDKVWYKASDYATGGVPGDHTVYIGHASAAVYFLDVHKFITLENINFSLSNFVIYAVAGSGKANSFEDITVKNCEFNDNAADAARFVARNGHTNIRLKFQNDTVNRTKNGFTTGSYSNGTDENQSNEFTGNTFNHIGYLDDEETTSWVDTGDREAIGIQNGDSCLISGNTFTGGCESGAIVYWSNAACSELNGNLVRNNTIDVLGVGIVWNPQGDGDVTGIIAYNILKNGGTGEHGPYAINPAMQLNRASVTGVYNNVVYNWAGAHFYLYSGTDNYILKNNISMSPVDLHVLTGVVIGANTLDYNLYYPDTGTLFNLNGTDYAWADWKTATGQDANSPTPADPLFTDPGSGDVTLQAGSPARNTGDNTVWAGTPDVTDYVGTAITNGIGTIVAPGGAVDIGAYEYPYGIGFVSVVITN